MQWFYLAFVTIFTSAFSVENPVNDLNEEPLPVRHPPIQPTLMMQSRDFLRDYYNGNIEKNRMEKVVLNEMVEYLTITIITKK